MKQETIEGLKQLRIEWLNAGCDVTKVAAARGITKQAVSAFITRINRELPLYVSEASPIERDALDNAARIFLRKRGIRFRTDENGSK